MRMEGREWREEHGGKSMEGLSHMPPRSKVLEDGPNHRGRDEHGMVEGVITLA
jgi:hypothetical protein